MGVTNNYTNRFRAYELLATGTDFNGVEGAMSSSAIDLNPHQIQAAMFALNSPVSKGAILADEVGLGKTIEAGLVLTKNSPSSDIMQWDMGILSAKMYVGNLRDNVKRSMEYNWLHGKWQGSAPTGYLNCDTEDGKATIKIDEIRGPLIRQMFEEYATGLYSLKDMVQWAKVHSLTSRGSKRFPSKPLCRVAIYQILKNPFYYGVMRIKGNYIPHIYEPLIDKSLFDKVQTILSGLESVHTKTEYASLDFALRGIFKCAKCGCTMSAEQHTKKSGKRYTYLRCSHIRGDCEQGLISEAEIFRQLEECIGNSFNISNNALEALKKEVRKELSKQANFDLDVKKQLQARLSTAQGRLDNTVNMLLDGVIGEDIYRTKKAQFESEIAELQAELAKYSTDDDNFIKIVENVIEVAGNVSRLIKSSKTDQKRAILKLILSNSTIDGKKAWFSLKKPFDLLLKPNGCLSWLCLTNNFRTDYYQDLIKMADEIEQVKDLCSI